VLCSVCLGLSWEAGLVPRAQPRKGPSLLQAGHYHRKKKKKRERERERERENQLHSYPLKTSYPEKKLRKPFHLQ
jgi:hypothetical protein